MFRQITFVRTVQLDESSEMLIKLSDNLEFTLCRNWWTSTHEIKNVKGDFEITKITETYDDGETKELIYDKSSSVFQACFLQITILTFYITAMVEMTEMKEEERNKKIREMCAVKYELQIPSALLQCLKICEYFPKEFFLPGYGYKFTYFVSKIKESTENDIEITIENPYNVEIEGKKGDYKFVCDSTKSIILPLLFNFYNDEIPIIEESEPNSNELHELPQESPIDESRPESVIPSFSSKATTLLHKIEKADLYLQN